MEVPTLESMGFNSEVLTKALLGGIWTGIKLCFDTPFKIMMWVIILGILLLPKIIKKIVRIARNKSIRREYRPKKNIKKEYLPKKSIVKKQASNKTVNNKVANSKTTTKRPESLKPKNVMNEIDPRKLKGMIGEEETAQALKELSKFELIRNPIFQAKNNRSCEIDIIVLHNTGLYVIENKNYDGDIYGSQKDYKWTQFFTTKRKYQFYNPVLQNARHIEVLKEILEDNRDIYYNVIIFGENANVSQVVKDYFMIVENKKDAVKRIGARMELDKKQLNDFELQKIYDKIIDSAKFDDETRKMHIASIRK